MKRPAVSALIAVFGVLTTLGVHSVTHAAALRSCSGIMSSARLVHLPSGPARLIIVSAPSGGGKTTLLRRLQSEFPQNFVTSISTTTRAPRPGEVDGVDYHFISVAEFKEKLGHNEFIEWNEVHGNYYGTSKKPVEEALGHQRSVLLAIDVGGARKVQEIYPQQSLSLFVMPPNMQVLEQRLRGRGTDPEAAIQKRLANAQGEIERNDEFDWIIINDQLEQAYRDLLGTLGLQPQQQRGT